MTTLQENYNYKKFKTKYYVFDNFIGPKIGEKAIDFDSYNLDGELVKLSDFKGKPIVLETGSVTCPIYSHNVNPMVELSNKYPDVTFLLLYIREAHPGNKISQHRDMNEKMVRAKSLLKTDQDTRTILVDDLEGTAHKLYSAFPNFGYVIDSDFIVRYKSEWNAPTSIEEVLIGLENNVFVDPLPNPKIGSMSSNIKVLKRGGWIAIIDFFPRLPKLIVGRIKLKRKWKKIRS